MPRVVRLILLFSWAAAASAAPPRFVVEGGTAELRAQLAADAARAYEAVQPWFDVSLDRSVTVRWVTAPGELGRIARDNPGAVAGVAVPTEDRILLFAPALAARPGRVPAVLKHEICHLLFAAATAGAEVTPPLWLNEGIAMRLSGDWDLGLEWRARDSSLLTDAAAAGSLLRFRALDSSFPAGPFFHVAYAQSHAFVDWLVGRAGEGQLRRFLRALDADEDPEPAFLSVYGLTLEEAEDDWRSSLGRSGWLGFLPSAGTLVTLLWIVLGLLVVAKFVQTRLRLRRAEDELGDGWD